jgi:hypothetical protein
MATLIHYDGELVAIAGPTRFYLAPHIEARPPTDRLRVTVVLMCAFAGRVNSGAVAGPYDDQRAEAYARAALADDHG